MISQSTPADPDRWVLKAPRQPMLWACVAYACGILLGIHEWRPTAWWIVAGAAFIASAGYFVQRRAGLGWALALGAIFLAGAFHVQVRSAGPRLDTSIQPYADRQPVQIVAHVVKDGRLRQDEAESFRQTIDIETEQILGESGQAVPVHSLIRLGIYTPRSRERSSEHNPIVSHLSVRVFHYGERIRCLARLRRPRNFRNPGAFDYEGYLAERGIAALGWANLEEVELLPGVAGSRIERWRSRVHRNVIAKVHELWPAREAALIDAMIVGEDAFIDRDTRTDFQRSGTYHVLVVSGMNVSILAFVVFWTLRRLRMSDFPATLLTIGMCIGYALITEVGAPVWRATLMCAVYLLTRLLYRERAMINAIGTAALALLIYDPRQILTPSFQMTFLCVLIVGAIAVPILQRTSLRYAQALKNWDSISYAAQLPPKVAQFRVELQMIAGRVAVFTGESWSRRVVCTAMSWLFAIWELVFLSAVMQMGLALPMAYYFHRATTLGLPANLLVVPLTQLLMPAALTALALGTVWVWLAKIPVLLTVLALHGIMGTVRGLGALQMADFRVAVPSFVVMMLASAALGLAMWGARRHRSVACIGIAAILAASLALAGMAPSPQFRPGVLELTSIDVGEGDSSLLISPEGKTLLIDAGGPIGASVSQFDFGEDVVSPYLWSRGISRLHAVAVTHAHSDHIGGIPAVLRNFRPKELWVGLEPPSAMLDNVLATAQSLGIRVIRRWEGDEFDFGGAHTEVFYPARDAVVADKARNNDSMVLRASYGDTSLLLEGDAEKTVERYVTSRHPPTATLLKVGHHGSTNATTAELVSSVRPAFAVISVGAGNSFGLPRTETLSRLSAAGARVYRTDLDGATTFYLDGQSVTVSVPALQ
ncbi:MAG: ComEC/Rec2 family competence protein [Candidatus Sulfotelmatobacter sp.]